MKKLIVLCGEDCAYCKKARMLIRRALEKEPKYIALDIRYVCDESPDAKSYPHRLIPAFFCGNELFFEGNPEMETITAVLKKCYE